MGWILQIKLPGVLQKSPVSAQGARKPAAPLGSKSRSSLVLRPLRVSITKGHRSQVALDASPDMIGGSIFTALLQTAHNNELLFPAPPQVSYLLLTRICTWSLQNVDELPSLLRAFAPYFV